MDKITIDGREVPRIVTHPEVPQPVELIEQRNGQCVSVETCSALARGEVDPAGDGEAAELVRWLWEHAGDTANVSGRWNGWQVAAWIATNDLAMVARLAGPIEFRGKAGSWIGERPLLHARTVEACLRWEIATRHCRCGAGAGNTCACLDDAFAKINAAIDGGAPMEIRRSSRDLVDSENAWQRLFTSGLVQMAFRLEPDSASPQKIRDWITRWRASRGPGEGRGSKAAWTDFHALSEFKGRDRESCFKPEWETVTGKRGRGRPAKFSTT